MSSGRYFKIILLCCGVCGILYNFAGGGASKLDRAIDEIERGPLLRTEVSEVIEMQPILGPRGDWVVHYEPRGPGDWEGYNSDQDDWLEYMEEEARLDKRFPKYGAMSSYPQYTVMSVSRYAALELGTIQDEEGMVRFVKNQKMDEKELICCDKLAYYSWLRKCFNPCGIAAYCWTRFSKKDEKYGFNIGNKSGSLVRTEWF